MPLNGNPDSVITILNFIILVNYVLFALRGPTTDKETHERINLTKHHIRYFPQKIAFVHSKCHDKIHDPENPITYLIDFKEGDSRKFYQNQKNTKLTLGSCAA